MKRKLRVIMLVFFGMVVSGSVVCGSTLKPVFAEDFEANPICNETRPSEMSEEEWRSLLEAAGCDIEDPAGEALSTLKTVLNAVYGLVAVLTVGMIVFGGFRLTISQGDSGKVKKAKDTILYAVIGLLVVLLAFAITNFVLGVI